MRLLKTLYEKEKFSAVEQSIIKYMIDNPKDIVNMSIRELANKILLHLPLFFVFVKNVV